MKKYLTLLLTFFALLMAGCKSKKEVTPTEVAPVWQNVSMPITLTVQSPMALNLNGTLTMVRGEYALMSFRTFGIEVAQACVTPSDMNLVLKMPSKLWVCEPIADRLSTRNIDFTKLQDQLVNPEGFMINVNEFSATSRNGATALTVTTTAKGVTLAATLSYNLNDAKWDSSNPASFSTPGSSYRKLDLQSAAKALGK